MNHEDQRTALYRLYDAEENLLYVGVSSDPRKRYKQHKRDKTWWPLVAAREAEWFTSRGGALAEERMAISREAPRFNRHLIVKPVVTKKSRERVLKGKVANMAWELARARGVQWARKYKVASGLHFLDLGEVSEDERRSAREERLPKIRGSYELLAEVSEYLGMKPARYGQIYEEHRKMMDESDKDDKVTRVAYDFGDLLHIMDIDALGAWIEGTDEVLPLDGDRDETLEAAGYRTAGQWQMQGEAEGVTVTRA